MTKKIALIDMDGTIADYYGAMKRDLEALASPTDPPLPEELHGGPDWLEARMDLIKRQDGWWRDLPKIELGFEVLGLLEVHGYKFTVLTKGPHRTRTAWTEKAQWCDKHLKDASLMMVDGDKPSGHKGLVYGKILFDDFPPYIDAWLANRPRGLAIMLDHPWNRDYNHPNLFRIKSKCDFADLAELLVARKANGG